jgi:hypothetical protein
VNARKCYGRTDHTRPGTRRVTNWTLRAKIIERLDDADTAAPATCD